MKRQRHEALFTAVARGLNDDRHRRPRPPRAANYLNVIINSRDCHGNFAFLGQHRGVQKYAACGFWIAPFILHSADAWAWGLYSHVFFSQLLLWTIPLADARFRRAIAKYPKLLLAGACLPDLALVGKAAGTGAFESTHEWKCARDLLAAAENDHELALATGYSCHLLVDVIAHNHFVPTHETMWLDVPVLTHALSEWAMDAHVAARVVIPPARLLNNHRHLLAAYVARNFGCTLEQAKRALKFLARAENALRASRIPQASYGVARIVDARVKGRFDYYIGQTSAHLAQISRFIESGEPLSPAQLRVEKAARRGPAAAGSAGAKAPLALPQNL